MDMDVLFVAVTGTNTLALVGLAFRAGRLVNKLEQAETRISNLEGAKTDIAIARFDEKISGVSGQLVELRTELRELSKAWRSMWQPTAHPGA